MDYKMIINLNKYPVYTKEKKILPIKSTLQLEEPFITHLDTEVSYKIDNYEIWFFSDSYWNSKQKHNKPLKYFWYRRLKKPLYIDFPDNLYIPYQDKESFKIPYHYYSKAYIPPLSLIYKENLESSIISFTIDVFGRLHCTSGYWALVEVIENKLPYIQAKIDFKSYIYPTFDWQIDLANATFNPQIIIPDRSKNFYELYGKIDSIAYNLIKSISKDTLELFLPYIYTKEETLYMRNFPEKFKILNGWIFPDGSSLFFKSTVLYHNLFLRRVCWLPLGYDEKNNWIKLDAIRSKDITDAIYNKKLVTKEALQTLNLYKRSFYIEETDISKLL